MKKYNYIKVIQEIDGILPSTNNKNYRITDVNELWEEILSLLEKLGLDQDPEVETLKEIVYKKQSLNSERLTTRLDSRSIAFAHDPNSFLTKERVEVIKISLQELIVKKLFPNCLIADSKSKNPNRLGTTDEILAFASKENISDYIKNLLAIPDINTKYPIILNSLVSIFAKDILLHYGIDAENYKNGATYNEIKRLIINAINTGYIIENHYIESERRLSKLNLDEINPEVFAIIEKITKIVYEIIKQYVLNHPVSKLSVYKEPVKSFDVEDNIDDSQIEQLDNIIIKHQKLIKLIQANREIAIQIKETTQKLAQLKAEYAKNNEIIKSTSHHV